MAMSRVAIYSKKALSGHMAGRTPEELLKCLVSQTVVLGATNHGGAQTNGSYCEELLLDVDLDGARYLLIRLPKTTRSRVQLSPREREIARMVAQGHPNKVIADVLNISSWTVCTHLRRIFAKLSVGSRAAMVARMLEEGRQWDQLTPADNQLNSTAHNSR